MLGGVRGQLVDLEGGMHAIRTSLGTSVLGYIRSGLVRTEILNCVS